jgi:SAM-dependent methyltransferase
MNVESLDLLICPNCSSDFTIKEIITQESKELINGIVECKCAKYPIVNGILILRESLVNLGITRLVEQGKTEEALTQSLFEYSFEKLNNYNLPVHSKFSWLIEKLLRSLGGSQLKGKVSKLYKLYCTAEIPFYDLLGSGIADTYTKQRFSSESFWSLYPFIPLLSKKKKNRILDLSCGAGHSSFVLREYVKPNQLFSVDFSFKNLFFTKKYFAPESQLICFDANGPLPFKTGVISSVLMLDAFHYIRYRALLVHEMERILDPTGLLLLLHVHNTLVFNLGMGTERLTPKDLYNLFTEETRSDVRLIPERKVLENFLFKDNLSLPTKLDETELNSSNAMILVQSKGDIFQTVFEGVQTDFVKIKDNLIINPIYKIEKQGNVIHLKRSSGDSLFGDHVPFSEAYLPKEIDIHTKSLSGRRTEISDTEMLKELQRKFVIINVPEKYA